MKDKRYDGLHCLEIATCDDTKVLNVVGKATSAVDVVDIISTMGVHLCWFTYPSCSLQILINHVNCYFINNTCFTKDLIPARCIKEEFKGVIDVARRTNRRGTMVLVQLFH